MVERMTFVIGIIVICALSCGIGGAIAALVLARRSALVTQPAADPFAPLAEQVARLADEQRHAHDETLNRLLDTNRALRAATTLYRSAGYTEVPAFNDEPYAHHWFEKRLCAWNSVQ